MSLQKITLATVKQIATTWPHGVLFVPTNEEEYDRLVEVLNILLDEIGENEDHPFIPMLDVVSKLVEDYDNEYYPIEGKTPVEVLQFLMAENGLKQSDLPEIGSQGNVSEILKGKRELNLRQIRKLSERFNLPPTVFLK